jgi:hypothetical protein
VVDDEREKVVGAGIFSVTLRAEMMKNVMHRQQGFGKSLLHRKMHRDPNAAIVFINWIAEKVRKRGLQPSHSPGERSQGRLQFLDFA